MKRALPRRAVIKVGTSTLTGQDGTLDAAYIQALAQQLDQLMRSGVEPLLVTSGAIRAGLSLLTDCRSSRTPAQALPLPMKQAAAAVGQSLLMQTYSAALEQCGRTCGQVLLTADDLAHRSRFLNAWNTLNTLLSLGVVPIVNENDTVAVEEIKFGDNDVLAARLAVTVQADLLLILSDVEGLLRDGRVVPVVRRIAEVEDLAGDTVSAVGTGGMRTKLEASRIATSAGIRVVITAGRPAEVVARVAQGEAIGTTFEPCSRRLRGRKRWIAAARAPRGRIVVNESAAQRILEGASVLAAGILRVEGEFGVGDTLAVVDPRGFPLGRGLTAYRSDEVRAVMGMKSSQFEEILGYRGSEEIIHRDNLVLEQN